MVCEFRTEIINFIEKYKGTDDLHEPYREFNFMWLESCNEEHVKRVKIEFDCICNERIWGDGDYDKEILGDFIESLEDLLKE
jgi:hypothetical protein